MRCALLVALLILPVACGTPGSGPEQRAWLPAPGTLLELVLRNESLFDVEAVPSDFIPERVEILSAQFLDDELRGPFLVAFVVGSILQVLPDLPEARRAARAAAQPAAGADGVLARVARDGESGPLRGGLSAQAAVAEPGSP